MHHDTQADTARREENVHPPVVDLPALERTYSAFAPWLMPVLTVWLLLRSDIVFESIDGELTDPMLATGLTTTVIGLWLAFGMEKRFLAAVRRLQEDRLTSLQDADLVAVFTALAERTRRWRAASAVGICLLVVVGYQIAIAALGGFEHLTEFRVALAILGFLVGERLGAFAGYGGLVSALEKRAFALHFIPGHPDGLGGTRDLGNFLAVQAILIGVLIGWLAYWLVFISHYEQYDQFTLFYRCLLAIALLYLYVAAIVPTLKLVPIYRAAKADLLRRDKSDLLRRIHEHKSRIDGCADLDRRVEETERMVRRIRQLEEINRLPTLPLGSIGTNFFSLATGMSFASFLLSFVIAKSPWMKLLDIAGKVLH